MPGLFARFKGRDGHRSKKKSAIDDLANSLAQKPKWDDAYTRKTVEPEEIHELLHCCTQELKARGLDLPFLLLPFRPTSDPSAVRSFIRHFFDHAFALKGDALLQELRMTEPMVISGVLKWCWSRLQGGVVGWDAYELFKVGEFDSNKARDSFKTFIPISVENGARQRIIFDFFDLIAAIAAHGKSNGFGGRQLSRLAAWWAFEHKDTGSGFDGGYKAWMSAADATSHLFFAYLRSLSPEQSPTGISLLPRSLEKLLKETPYPPPRSQGMRSSTNKLVMTVDSVSPTPFALLRRAGHFQYRDSDSGLQEFSNYDDPVQALTEECLRVLKAISSANQSHVSSIKHSTSLRDASWSRFEDMGFGSTLEEEDEYNDSTTLSRPTHGLRSTPASGNQLARPMTPSWADFLSSGFVDETSARPNLLLPPDKVLPPIEIRQHSSQSHRPRLESERNLEPGELASIAAIELDDVFWWVWMSSLAPEETSERKAAFGRCALIETKISSSRWIIMEEKIAGAASEPQEGAYIAEKKGFFSWTKRNKTMARRRSTGRQALERGDKNAENNFGDSKASFGVETHARIQAKAAQLRAINDHEQQVAAAGPQRRGRSDAELMAEKTNSVLTLQPTIVGEASSAMKWVKKYDKGAIKDAYMANTSAGRGLAVSPTGSDFPNGSLASNMNGASYAAQSAPPQVPRKDLSTAPSASPRAQQIQSPPPKPEHREARASASDEAEEADIHPLDRKNVAMARSPLAPPKDFDTAVIVREATTPEPAAVGLSSEPNKLHKPNYQGNKDKSGGLRKLFARKNRSSKLPDNAPADLNGMLDREQSVVEPELLQSPTPAATPSPTHENRTPMQLEKPETPAQLPSPKSIDPPHHVSETSKTIEYSEPTYEPSVGEDLGDVDTRDAAEASQEFSRFDQGPLVEQPAFVPDEDDEDGEGDATPPPIARHPTHQDVPQAEKAEDKLSQSASPGVQDRWAQIRKNAAQRAATKGKDEPTRSAPTRATEGDDDTSGEETIESRVARIKARVAELTGNMEASSSPQAVANRH